MKSYRKELWFEVPSRRAFINITPQVEQCLRELARDLLRVSRSIGAAKRGADDRRDGRRTNCHRPIERSGAVSPGST